MGHQQPPTHVGLQVLVEVVRRRNGREVTEKEWQTKTREEPYFTRETVAVKDTISFTMSLSATTASWDGFDAWLHRGRAEGSGAIRVREDALPGQAGDAKIVVIPRNKTSKRITKEYRAVASDEAKRALTAAARKVYQQGVHGCVSIQDTDLHLPNTTSIGVRGGIGSSGCCGGGGLYE